MKVIIVGGGASGLMAALTASERPDARVVPLERQARVGRKLLATGNGRCNLTNQDASLARFHGGDRAFIAAVLSRFSVATTVDFFEELGVACEVEGGGRVDPRPRQASAVLDVLRWELERLQVAPEAAAAVTEVLTQCDFARFSPGLMTVRDPHELFEKARDALGRI